MSRGNITQERSALFLLRMWSDLTNEHPAQTVLLRAQVPIAHGRLLHVYTGEGRNFADWQELVQLLQEMLNSSGQQS